MAHVAAQIPTGLGLDCFSGKERRFAMTRFFVGEVRGALGQAAMAQVIEMLAALWSCSQ